LGGWLAGRDRIARTYTRRELAHGQGGTIMSSKILFILNDSP